MQNAVTLGEVDRYGCGDQRLLQGAFTEPEAGSDLNAVATRADRSRTAGS
jgi:alkylation response protein AidB-like acyl-CoA dehydrogenase